MRLQNNGMPPVVFTLLLLNVGIFGLQQVPAARGLLIWGMLWPLGEGFMPWQPLTYAFLHGSVFHIAVNMFAVWMFGSLIETTLGSRAFVLYYLVSIVGAAVTQLLVAFWSGNVYPTIGASGGVFGILLAFGMLYPNQMVVLMIPPIPMRAKWFVLVFGAIELWAGVTGSMAGVAHFAHLGGMAFGFMLLQYWRGRLPIKPSRRLMR